MAFSREVPQVDDDRRKRLLTYARAHILAAQECLKEVEGAPDHTALFRTRLQTMAQQLAHAASLCCLCGARARAVLPPSEMAPPPQALRVIGTH